AGRERRADVAFVAAEDRADVDEEDVVVAELEIDVGFFVVLLRRVRTEADVRRMPDALHAKAGEDFEAKARRFGFAQAGRERIDHALDGAPRLRARKTHRGEIERSTDGFLRMMSGYRMCNGHGNLRIREGALARCVESKRGGWNPSQRL